MQQGLVTLDTPVELSVKDGKFIIKLKNKITFIRWDDGFLDAIETQALLEFVRFVYKAGYSDGSIQALMNPNQPAGNYILREATCNVNPSNGSCYANQPDVICVPTSISKTEG